MVCYSWWRGHKPTHKWWWCCAGKRGRGEGMDFPAAPHHRSEHRGLYHLNLSLTLLPPSTPSPTPPPHHRFLYTELDDPGFVPCASATYSLLIPHIALLQHLPNASPTPQVPVHEAGRPWCRPPRLCYLQPAGSSRLLRFTPSPPTPAPQVPVHGAGRPWFWPPRLCHLQPASFSASDGPCMQPCVGGHQAAAGHAGAAVMAD